MPGKFAVPFASIPCQACPEASGGGRQQQVEKKGRLRVRGLRGNRVFFCVGACLFPFDVYFCNPISRSGAQMRVNRGSKQRKRFLDFACETEKKVYLCSPSSREGKLSGAWEHRLRGRQEKEKRFCFSSCRKRKSAYLCSRFQQGRKKKGSWQGC